MQKLKLKEIKQFDKVHTATEWKSWLASEPRSALISCYLKAVLRKK